MSGRRRPWATSLLALVLGLVGFALMFMADATDDYSGWPLVVAAAQLPWLWIVDLRGRGHDDQAHARMSRAARITASISIGLAGGVSSAAQIAGALELIEAAGVASGWVALAGPVALMALPLLPLFWGARAWRVSKTRTSRTAVRAMLGSLTLFSLPAVGLAWAAHRMTRDSHELLGGVLAWLALVGALVVLAWTTLPWLELYLSARGSHGDAGAAQTARAPETRA